MRRNTLEGHELWLRCPSCGDSQHNANKAHLSVNTTNGFYHCFRCGYGGALQAKQLIELLQHAEGADISTISYRGDTYQQEFELSAVLDDLEPGAATSRRSRLERFTYQANGLEYDAFIVYSSKGHERGVHLRLSTEKKMMNIGSRGLSPASDFPLDSSPTHPLRLVEGPYDVLYPNDICLHGTISSGRLAELPGHFLDLCPDGDIWEDPKLLKQFVRAVSTTLKFSQAKGPWITAIEFIPDGRDPDEVPASERTRIEPLEFLRQAKPKRYARLKNLAINI